MKKYLSAFVLSGLFILTSAQDTWVNKNLFPDSARSEAAGFVLNGRGYIIGGATRYSPGGILTNQVWQYNPITDSWIQKGNYPHKTNEGAFFAINNKGYHVGGFDTAGYYDSDNYQYNVTTDNWTLKSPFPENGLGGGFYFVINGVAYVGAGARNANVHGVVSGYSYNPAADSWNSIADYPGNPSICLCSFTIDSFGYAGMGGNGNDVFYNDMYKYDPRNNRWSAIAPFPGKARFINEPGFVIDGKAYVGAGETILNGSGNAYALGDYYVYDPVANSWSYAPGLQGPPRFEAAVLSFGDSAYLVGGYNQDGAVFYRYVDEFKPTGTVCSTTDTLFISITTGIAPNTTLNTLNVYPNPGHNQLYINTGNYASMSGYSLKITNPMGQTVFTNAVSQQLFAINTSSWTAGVYFLQVINPSSAVVATKEIVVQ